MGSWKMLSLMVLAAVASSPRGASAAEVTAAGVAPPPVAPARLARFGLMADAGVPDGASASLVYRPMRWLRAQVGGGYNLISPGVRAGVTLIPLGWGPSATLEGGHYFDGNANGMARRIAGSDFKNSALLERVGYDFANAHLGFEIGSRRVTFFVHGGMSYIRGTLHNANTALQADSGGLVPDGSSVSIKQDPVIKVVAPSAKLGLIVYLW
jgi:hypothetical protein